MTTARFDVAVIGGGPSGLSAALAANKHGAKTLLIERDAVLGGKLKQYMHRFIRRIRESGVETKVSTFVSRVEKKQADFELTLVNREGVIRIKCKSIVLACGCRERLPFQIGIHARHLSGIFTTAAAQYYTNVFGKMPARRCVIFSSIDIGLIIARQLKLKGVEVLGVYEEKTAADSFSHNAYRRCTISVCPEPQPICEGSIFGNSDIPLYTGKTVTRIFGEEHVAAVEITSVDRNMIPVPGTEKIIECDALILSAGLIPENELAERLGISLNVRKKVPEIDQNYMTTVDGVFCCGSALDVNSSVDNVSESGESAGRAAAEYAETGNSRRYDPLLINGGSMKHFTKTKTETASAARSITTTVRTAFPRIPVLPVRTNGDVPKEKVTEIIRELSKVVISEKIGIGEIVVADVLGTGCNVIAASDILKKILV